MNRIDRGAKTGMGRREIVASVVLLAAGMFLALQGWTADGAHRAFAHGDLFVSLVSGQVQWRHPDGSLNTVLIGLVPGTARAMAFDAAGNFYVPHWCGDFLCRSGNTVEKFDPTGRAVGTFGGGYAHNPNSIVFDAAGNAYVGQSDAPADIVKFDAVGTPLVSFDAATEVRGTDWIDLAGDGCTILYTSRGKNILRYDTCARAQRPNFNSAPLPGESALALRVLPDGGVLVADSVAIVRLNAFGAVVRTYTVPGEPGLWAGLDLAGDGTFWASNWGSSNVYRFDLATGAVLASFNAVPTSSTVVGIAVKR
ncbi:MAG: hypothetical protein HY560_12415 [Gemmatimonadetes bacterium]|nr:hypothetical protein [Gemmatimonadota bacterium]